MDIFIIYMIVSVVIGCLLALLIMKLIKIAIKFIVFALKKKKSLKDKPKTSFEQRIKDTKPKPNESNPEYYYQEQIDIIELQEKVEMLEKRVEKLENQNKKGSK